MYQVGIASALPSYHTWFSFDGLHLNTGIQPDYQQYSKVKGR